MASCRSERIPVYIQAKTALIERIAAEGLGPGDRLPSEASLAADLGINRLTVRRAVLELAREGTVTVRNGAGIFVSPQPTVVPVNIEPSQQSFVERLQSALTLDGQTWREVLVSVSTEDDPGIRADLRTPRARITRLETLNEIGDEAWILSTWWVPTKLVRGLEHRWGQRNNVYGTLLKTVGELRVQWRTYSACLATAEDAAALGVAPGAALILREGLTTDARGNPVMRARRRYRPDRIVFVDNRGSASPSPAPAE